MTESREEAKTRLRGFYKGIETKLQTKTGWGRNDVLALVRDVQVSVLAQHLAQATAQLHPQIFQQPPGDLPWEP